MSRLLALLLLLPVLAACAGSRYCERIAQTYEDIPEQAPLQAPEGLQVPPSDPNFAIPEATGEDVRYATSTTDAKGRRQTACLDAPPPMPPVRGAAEPGPAPEVESAPESGADAPPAEPGA
jgi:uncharacterized lipoprotein